MIGQLGTRERPFNQRYRTTGGPADIYVLEHEHAFFWRSRSKGYQTEYQRMCLKILNRLRGLTKIVTRLYKRESSQAISINGPCKTSKINRKSVPTNLTDCVRSVVLCVPLPAFPKSHQSSRDPPLKKNFLK